MTDLSYVVSFRGVSDSTFADNRVISQTGWIPAVGAEIEGSRHRSRLRGRRHRRGRARTRLRGNAATDNGDLGIEAVPGTIDLGGNTASGNGNPLQCLNVVCR